MNRGIRALCVGLLVFGCGILLRQLTAAKEEARGGWPIADTVKVMRPFSAAEGQWSPKISIVGGAFKVSGLPVDFEVRYDGDDRTIEIWEKDLWGGWHPAPPNTEYCQIRCRTRKLEGVAVPYRWEEWPLQ